METKIDHWYYLGNGHWYIYYDEDTQTLKKSDTIDYWHINNYLFNILLVDYISHPNFYVNLYDTEYSKIPVFNLVCKAVPNKLILPADTTYTYTNTDGDKRIVNTYWQRDNTITKRDNRLSDFSYKEMYWLLADYEKWFEYDINIDLDKLSNNDLDFEIGNLIYVNRENNNILGLYSDASKPEIYIDGYMWHNLRFMHASNETIQFYTNNVEVYINTENVFEENNIIYIFSTNVNMNTVNGNDIIHMTSQKNNVISNG